MLPPLRELSPQQVAHFLDHGFVTIERALDPAFCEEQVQQAWVRLGIKEHDRSTWNFTRTNMPNLDRFEFAKAAPRAYAAICDLLGGEDRVRQPCEFGNNLIIVLNNADTPWVPPSPSAPGWHKDGDWFHHFLDSPEQALLAIVVWRDIEPRGGGTFFACDSVREVAKYYAQKPEGGYPTNFGEMLSRCSDFRELTGRQGDVVLMHGYMLHAVSINTRPEPRVICNACPQLWEPMNFNRADASDFSPLEQSVLRGLGVERLDFKITGQRGRIKPQREIEWEKRREEERLRLAQQQQRSQQ